MACLALGSIHATNLTAQQQLTKQKAGACEQTLGSQCVLQCFSTVSHAGQLICVVSSFLLQTNLDGSD